MQAKKPTIAIIILLPNAPTKNTQNKASKIINHTKTNTGLKSQVNPNNLKFIITSIKIQTINQNGRDKAAPLIKAVIPAPPALLVARGAGIYPHLATLV